MGFGGVGESGAIFLADEGADEVPQAGVAAGEVEEVLLVVVLGVREGEGGSNEEKEKGFLHVTVRIIGISAVAGI